MDWNGKLKGANGKTTNSASVNPNFVIVITFDLLIITLGTFQIFLLHLFRCSFIQISTSLQIVKIFEMIEKHHGLALRENTV